MESNKTSEASEISPTPRVIRSVARQACDSCRSRKKRCDYGAPSDTELRWPSDDSGGHKCSSCTRQGIECTFLIPSNVRGPRRRDKHVASTEERTARSTSSPLAQEVGTLPYPRSGWQQSPRPSPGETLQSASSDRNTTPHASLNTDHNFESPQRISQHAKDDLNSDSHLHPTDELCSRAILRMILDDYLDLVYPLIPVIHRPTFISHLQSNHDTVNKDFFCLIICLCATTVGLLQRRFSVYRSASGPATPGLRFSSRTEMINACYEICLRQRSPSYFDKVNHMKWASAYLMQIAMFQLGNHNMSRMLEVEAMQLARLLGLHRIADYAGLNAIEVQLRKKAFWLMFYSYVHSQLQNWRRERLSYIDTHMSYSINLAELMPLEVDDEMIFEDGASPPQHGDSACCLQTGFNVHSRVFWATLENPDLGMTVRREKPSEWERLKDPTLQVAHLEERISDLRYLLDGVVPELRQWAPISQADSINGASLKDDRQKRILSRQFTILRSNLHVTHLWLQSILLDQIDAVVQYLPPASTNDNGHGGCLNGL